MIRHPGIGRQSWKRPPCYVPWARVIQWYTDLHQCSFNNVQQLFDALAILLLA